MMPMAVSNLNMNNHWHPDDGRHRAMTATTQPSYQHQHQHQHLHYQPDHNPYYDQTHASPRGMPPAVAARTTPDALPPPFHASAPRSVPSSSRSARRPPPALTSPRWDSLGGGQGAHMLASPTSPRLPPSLRSRPTTPVTAAYPDAHDSYSGPPSRPLTAKTSFPDIRSAEPASAPDLNFSRPRKQSVRQPLLPTPSEDGPEMFQNPLPNPWRPRRPSVSSNVSASTWAPGMSPTSGEFSDGRARMRYAGPPPVSATRQHFSYGNRIDSTGSAPPMGGTAPWVSGDEVRSSFRSQLTASSAPGTANTERSSIMTKDSSATSFDANHDHEEDHVPDADEPSVEDVMGMYEQGFDDDDDGDNEEENLADGDKYNGAAADPVQGDRDDDTQLQLRQARSRDASSDRAATDVDELYFSKHSTSDHSEPSQPQPPPSAPAPPIQPVIIEEDLAPPTPAQMQASKLDAEIRQSRMFFSSPAFMASVSHLANADVLEEEKRDSGKSLESDPSEGPQPMLRRDIHASTTTSPHSSILAAMRGVSSSPVSPSSPITPLSPAPTAVEESVEPEAPGSRDRYGFKKETQHVSRKQYDRWDRSYSEYLARRKKKWVAYLKESSLMTDEPNRFPGMSPKTKKFVRKGIPPEWRGAAWFYYAGGPAILAKYSGLYDKMLQLKAKRVDVEAIERDLHRTFPDNINFKPPGTSTTNAGNGKIAEDDTVQAQSDEPPIISSLRRVLFAFSIYNPNIGYCQSLNFIAGLLLLFVDTEEQCFWLLNVITNIYLPGTHEMSLEGSKVDLGVLMTEIRDTMPAVWDKISGELEAQPSTKSRPSTGRSMRRPNFRRRDHASLSTERLPPITMCMTAWFMSCFIGTLPIETTLRVWDVFFLEGSKTLFRTALAIFKTGESEVLGVTDPMEMFGVVQSMPRKMLDANALMDACFKRRNGFNHLSQGAIEERRQERRDKTASDKKGGGGGSRTVSGTTTDNEDGARRVGTLFRRKKRDASRPRGGEA
ncbi:GTPase-activating protein-like protein [Emericellopsis cladophorae]|uniref:GTPase-activating protein-like protein n=1 Tax=Emericellopsis cladophorae TaxID=2686198 RepID=A0A9P9XUN1_9HYPO|nr:GTPase-activating protein-like protein [Emericellopsis cladophorae]KAI6777908.1 GTPase-activating protein-like protein [Emericellopsis cladophorae]